MTDINGRLVVGFSRSCLGSNRAFQNIFQAGGAPCVGSQPGAPICPLAVNMNTFPSGTLKTPYFLEWSLGLERELGAHGSLRVDYVGTRAVQEPYQVQLNGYQTVCDGCFAPFAYNQPLDRRFASVNEFRTGAGSHYSGLQTSADQADRRADAARQLHLQSLPGRGIERRVAAVFQPRHSLPSTGDLRKEYGNCDYDVRHNLSAFGIYKIPFHSSHRLLRQMLGGWRFRKQSLLHSGLPFSVLSAPYTANNNGIFQGSGPQYAIAFPVFRSIARLPVAGVTQAGSRQWLNPDAFASVVDPSTGACAGGDSPANCQFGNSGRNNVRGPHFTYSEMYLTRRIPITERVSFRLDAQAFNVFNHRQFCFAHQSGGRAGKACDANGIWRID